MTSEEAKKVFINRGFVDGVFDGDKWRESVVVISKWLEQKSVLDKIRTEVEKMPSELSVDGRRMIKQVNVLKIIDKYRTYDIN